MSGESPVLGDELVLEQGTVIGGKYVLERPAGFGGMAQLWVATNQSTRAEVCVKIFVRTPPGNPQDHPSPAHEEEAIERFRREAHAAANLSHRAIVRVFDLIEIDVKGAVVKRHTHERPHAYVIVMELLHGETLGDTLATRGKLPLEEALDIFLPVVSALAHAHRASVIHRDVKPDNIFLARDPDDHVIPKVLDFGVSKISNADAITIDGILVGTPSFMSPEQAKGAQRVDARSDVFSAGTLLYMMLTGANPFEESSFSATVNAVIRKPVAPLEDLPPAIWTVLAKALEKDPMLRYGDATEMGIALRKACGRKSTESNPMMPLPPLSSRTSITNEVSPSAPNGSSGPISEPLSSRRRGPSEISIPPNEPSSSSLTGELVVVGDAARRKRRAVALAIVGGSAMVVLAAVTMSWMSKPAPPSSAPDVRSAANATSPSAPPSSLALASAAPSTAPIAPAATASPTPSTSTPTNTKRDVRKPRRPGEEPNKARDPGF